MGVDEIGNLTITQFQTLLFELQKVEKERYKTLLIITRAASRDDDAFQKVLEAFED